MINPNTGKTMRQSFGCAALPEDDNGWHVCDGTAFGNAADDAAFMASLPQDEDWTCHCICHNMKESHGS